MGMTVYALLLAAAQSATPADGHSVAPLAGAKPSTELSCEGVLKDAYLAPAEGGLGVRAPLLPGKVKCTLKNGDKPTPVELDFTDPGDALVLGQDHPVIFGVDKEALVNARGELRRADSSSGQATVENGSVKAALPQKRFPQNLVVLGVDGAGNAGYAVVPLLGKAKVAVKTRKNSSLEATVAGHRTSGFKSDKKGKVEVSVPAPPGFTSGALEVVDKKGRSNETALDLPKAPEVFALAALGPETGIDLNGSILLWAAGANPAGLAPADKDLAITATGATVGSRTQVKPGLWRIEAAPTAVGDAVFTLKLGNATRTVSVKVAAPAPIAKAPDKQPELKQPEKKPEVAQVEAKGLDKQPEGQVEKKPEVKVEVKKPASDDDGSIRLGLLVEAGYLTNFGAIGALAPGAGVQVAYRLGSLDVGGGADMLVASSSSTGSVAVPGSSVSLSTSTTVQTLQVLVGPWARYRFTDFLGVDLQAGAGLSRVSQTISANNTVNASGLSNTLAYGGLAGVDLTFGLARVFVGARYAQSAASGAVTGPAGGLAGLVGVGVDLGI